MYENQTIITEFILLGFGDIYSFQILLFPPFLVIYIVTVMGNTLIFGLVVFDRHLYTPMYFFLGNLSFLEACYSSTLFPRMLLAFLTGNRMISFDSCLIQWYIYCSLEVTECCLLCAMSYDRYLAICKPLHYAITMTSQTCIQLAAAAWINGFFICLILLIMMLQLTFCGPNEMDHYFCDYFPILKVSCSDTSLIKMVGTVVAAVFTLPPFLLTLTSYVYIIATMLKIPSSTGRKKAFSTCSSHLVVVSIFYGSLMIAYMVPEQELKRNMGKFPSLLYTVLPPLLNPFIYSLRNKEVKDALRNIVEGEGFSVKSIKRQMAALSFLRFELHLQPQLRVMGVRPFVVWDVGSLGPIEPMYDHCGLEVGVLPAEDAKGNNKNLSEEDCNGRQGALY
ncbi:olfactory receptor 2AP1-like [Heteronotia binoei]|uniref:olfactory receptor 2AP1-like n=1 Tax=Heteronotia binoei TaxID=13085 RepID=UPI00292D44EA|nr:olfactory receptor 2AP1-like [Heteronotia binoei]